MFVVFDRLLLLLPLLPLLLLLLIIVVAVVASSAAGGGGGSVGGGFVSGMEIEQMEIVVTWMFFFPEGAVFSPHS